VGFEFTIPLFELKKTFHALDHMAAVVYYSILNGKFNRKEKNFINIIKVNNNYCLSHHVSSHLYNVDSVKSFITNWPRDQMVRKPLAYIYPLIVEPRVSQHSYQSDPDVVRSILPIKRQIIFCA
jgi:hypothetical protein